MEIIDLSKYKNAIEDKRFTKYTGEITQVTGLTIESNGPMATIGELCEIYPRHSNEPVLSEVVGFKDDKILLMPLGEMEGIANGSRVVGTGRRLEVNVGESMKGRVLDGLGRPIDGLGPIISDKYYPVSETPPNPLDREIIKQPLPVGIRAIDGLLTCGKGQRVGIFAGSGVGKSTLLGMISRNSTADINVIALIGERGREVKEFLENDLTDDGLERSVVIAVTSDQPALIRVKGAQVATAVAEYFRDQGLNVMLLMDSLTRFSMAQREIGLAVGEPPVTRGFPPSVFAEMPKLLERAGTSEKGTITGLYTVLVDGDDLNEPITDTARGILDGHIVLSRKIANANHYPAIDVLASVSRVMSNVTEKEHIKNSNKIKDIMATYNEAEDLINIGAYKKGSNKKIDASIDVIDDVNSFLQQGINEEADFQDSLKMLERIAGEIE